MGYIENIRSKVGHDAIFMPASTAVIYSDGKVLLQLRHDNNTWATHGGAMELGETYLETLERELKEEINIVPIEPKLIGIYSGKERYNKYPNGDIVYIIVALFLVEKYEGNLSIDECEVNDIKWFDLDNLPQNIHKPDIELLNSVKKFLETKEVICS